VELAVTLLSIAGLLLAIIDYECNVAHNSKGIGIINDDLDSKHQAV